MASRLAFIHGMLTQPRNAPKHQTQTLPLKARQKFSVHMESIRQPQMAFTRLLGVFMKEARMLPSSVEMPMTVLTTPIARSETFDSTMAGNAALYMDATTASIPQSPSTAVAKMGVRMEVTEEERYRSPPTLW